MNKELAWLILWYASHCDTYWEHIYGFSLQTTENFDWELKIRLADTELEDAIFEEVNILIDKTNWINCNLHQNQFKGNSSTNNVIKMLQIFREWAQPYSDIFFLPNESASNDDFIWLLRWYHENRTILNKSNRKIKINTIDNPGVALSIYLENFGFENIELKSNSVHRNDNNWRTWWIRNQIFDGCSSPLNFFEILNDFRNFIENNDQCPAHQLCQ